MNFNQKVWDACKRIPSGKVSTYKEVALFLDSKAYRAVGNALNKNSYPVVVPCHRVVASDGSLGGFAFGPKKKIALLKKEGVSVKKGKIVDFEERLFSF